MQQKKDWRIKKKEIEQISELFKSEFKNLAQTIIGEKMEENRMLKATTR
jgi:hypothetical protein